MDNQTFEANPSVERARLDVRTFDYTLDPSVQHHTAERPLETLALNVRDSTAECSLKTLRLLVR